MTPRARLPGAEQLFGAERGIRGDVIGEAGATARPRDFRGLARMRERIGKRLVAGLVVYTGERTLPFGDGLWAAPRRDFEKGVT